MTQVGLKMLFWPIAITVILLFATGIVEFKKPDYSCLKGKHIRFADKVEVVTVGNFRIHAYPLVHDCPIEERFQPDEVKACGSGGWCRETDL